MRLPAVLLLCLVALASCAPMPPLGTLGPGDTTPPPLLPIDEMLAQGGATSSDPGPALAARAARLKARAAAIATTSVP